MEIFYSKDIEGNICRLDAEESGHCIKVLRHRIGDEINVIDGTGTMMRCIIIQDSPKGAAAEIIGKTNGWGVHPYRLTLAVAPTKNSDRYEWFAEKACEIGVDMICPVIGQHSERKILKTQRVEKIVVSASKQSLKGSIPQISEPVSVKEFIMEHGAKPQEDFSNGETSATGHHPVPQDGVLRLIAYCFEDEKHKRTSIVEALASYAREDNGLPEIIVMIGPEGDFSEEEADLAMKHGFIPVHLGPSRLRTETAAVTAAEAVYFRFLF